MGSGFFSSFDLTAENKHLADAKAQKGCPSCGLNKKCKTPRMPLYGQGRRGVLIVGDIPGKFDDACGKPWQKSQGVLFARALKREAGLDLEQDCYTTHAVLCAAGRQPTNDEIQICHKRLVDTILKVKPHIILLVGGVALRSFLMGRWRKGSSGIMTWRGYQIPDTTYNAWAVPLLDPLFVEGKQDYKEVDFIFRQDIRAIRDLLDKPLPAIPTLKQVRVLYQEDDIAQFLKRVWGQNVPISFDYETTGRKPQREGHRIVCVSIAPNKERSYAFPYPKSKKGLGLLKRVLAHKETPKIAHNLKFEDTWTNEIMKTPVNNWLWDSMQAAHILDNRVGVSGLKFQSYANFGIVDYDSHISSYLTGGDNKNANSFNRIHELEKSKQGMHQLLEYCGFDSLLTYHLALKQMEEMRYDLPDIP